MLDIPARTLPSGVDRAARRRSFLRWSVTAVVLLLMLAAFGIYLVAFPERAPAALARPLEDWTGANTHPVALVRPPVQPLSALARIGDQIFHDTSLSASRRQSCASCHAAALGYGPPNGLAVQPGGPTMTGQVFRTPPSLAYLYRQEPFGIGPSLDEDAPQQFDQIAQQQAQAGARSAKVAGAAAAPAVVPSGGLFWDGRADTLQLQAAIPMTNPAEMANHDFREVVRKIAASRYRDEFKPLFGDAIADNPDLLFQEAMSAVSRYQVEFRGFHRFDSKYDQWLEGKARLSRAEMRGLRLFNDPAKGNCAGCHVSQPGLDGMPPLFTDTEYEALGVPRNAAIPANRDPHFYDLGLCGPLRTDLAKQTQYCGMFLTPTLRNSARRKVFFHNGVYHSLKQVLDFYNLRDADPARIYPRGSDGKVARYNDLPARFHANIDIADAPFGRKPGSRPPLTDAEIQDIIAFIKTLNDGDRPASSHQPGETS